ncbi:MAG: glycosyltransferase family 39 protein [Fimbriimonadaceae bacterium]|nr:glycosyltransferase family 39 protein [Fimbriimonadaceae bacterium]
MAEASRAAPWWVPASLALWCLLVRLPGHDLPLLEEGHAWRQSVTAMLARNFHRHGYRLPWPEIDVPGHQQPAGAPAYTNSEFPLYPWTVALVYHLTGVHESVGRLLAALAAVVVTLALYALGNRLGGGWLGAVAAGWWALQPLSIFYTRAFLPEAWMLAATVLAVAAAVRWVAVGDRWAAGLALGCGTLAPLLKQPAIGVVLPLAVAVTVREGWAAWRRPRRWLVVALPLLACLAWDRWAGWLGTHYAGHFAVGGGSGLINPSLWSQPTFWRRLAAVLLLLVGCGSAPLLALCGLRRPQDGQAVLLAWAGVALAGALVANGATVTHYYYNLALLPPLALLLAQGCTWPRPRLRWIAVLLAVGGPLWLLDTGLVTSWYDVRGSEVAAAAAVRRLTPPGDLVYTHCYGTQLLYAADRRGDFLITEPSFMEPRSLRDAAQAGLRWFVSGRRDLIDSPAGAALRGYLAGCREVAGGPGWGLWQLPEVPR